MSHWNCKITNNYEQIFFFLKTQLKKNGGSMLEHVQALLGVLEPIQNLIDIRVKNLKRYKSIRPHDRTEVTSVVSLCLCYIK